MTDLHTRTGAGRDGRAATVRGGHGVPESLLAGPNGRMFPLIERVRA